MTILAKIILDSIAPNGARLTTFELTYPRIIHSEIMTHRVFSRNAASSRAIPTKKKIERIKQDMAKPSQWGSNKPGMQAGPPLSEEHRRWAETSWYDACQDALSYANSLESIGCHKQVSNRLLEPFDHITTVLSSTKYGNHDILRTAVDENGDPLPDPTYFELATKMKIARQESQPKYLQPGQWHLPYTTEQDLDGLRANEAAVEDPDFLSTLKKISVGRCARVSYLRQGEGDVKANVELHDRLAKSGHWSPFEHQATPMGEWKFGANEKFPCDGCGEPLLSKHSIYLFKGDRALCNKCGYGHIHSGNFHGWHQYRKEFSNEAGGDL